jgi:hypothetical protein
MKEKILYGLMFFIPLLFIIITAFFNCREDLFMGLKPKAVYGKYKIFDIVEQKGLACAEAIEFLDYDDKYSYYFPCLKSDKIYFVSDDEVIKVRQAYEKGIITKEKLYQLGIVNRMVKYNEE